MEMAYIQAENLKHKRTFTKTLIVLAPFVTALMNFLPLFGSRSILIIGGITCFILDSLRSPVP